MSELSHTLQSLSERGPEVEFIRIRLRKDGRWYDRDGGRYAPAAAPRKFYDFNF